MEFRRMIKGTLSEVEYLFSKLYVRYYEEVESTEAEFYDLLKQNKDHIFKWRIECRVPENFKIPTTLTVKKFIEVFKKI